MTSALFQPLVLNDHVTLKNRFAKGAMSEKLGDKNHHATQELIDLYQAWALGGTGLLMTGNVMVDARALGEHGNVVIEDESGLPQLKRWAQVATSHDVKTFVQLNHPGRQSPKSVSKHPVAPSAVPLQGANAYGFNHPRALSNLEIKVIIQKFINAAVIVKKAGFSGVEIHAAHGYLIDQFLSPLANQRTDEYGGSLENRMRFLVEIYQGMRQAVGPDFPIAVKINASDYVDGGFSEEDSLQVIEKLDQLGVDLIEISGGGYENNLIQGVGKGAFFVQYAAKAKQRVHAPLMVTGGFATLAGMEKALDDGAADLIGLARPLALMPDLPNRVKAGKFTQIKLEHLTTGNRALDKRVGGVVGLAYYQEQMERLAKGRGIERTTNAWKPLLYTLRKEGLGMLLPERA